MAIDTSSLKTRRAILMGALGGAVAAGAAAVGRASPIDATNGDIVHIGHHYSATKATVIRATGSGAFYGISDSGDGVSGGSDSGIAVSGDSDSGIGVFGVTNTADRPAILGGNLSYGTGVEGISGSGDTEAHSPPPNAGVCGLGTIGVYGGGAVGVFGRSEVGTGVVAYAGPGDRPGGHAKTAIYAAAPSGRGVVASGGKAQLRLLPSSEATHPVSGALGDLFVDKPGRLWFCRKGGNPAVWKQVSLL